MVRESTYFAISYKYCEIALEIASNTGNIFRIEDMLYAKWWNKEKETKTTDKKRCLG